jgi:hypothetical protein
MAPCLYSPSHSTTVSASSKPFSVSINLRPSCSFCRCKPAASFRTSTLNCFIAIDFAIGRRHSITSLVPSYPKSRDRDPSRTDWVRQTVSAAYRLGWNDIQRRRNLSSHRKNCRHSSRESSWFAFASGGLYYTDQPWNGLKRQHSRPKRPRSISVFQRGKHFVGATTPHRR